MFPTLTNSFNMIDIWIFMERTFGIKREDKSEWERRAPITPLDVLYLDSTHSIKTIIQPSKFRVFSDKEYDKVGALVSENLDAPVILGIKEIHPDFFEEDKIYVFFSHTIKGQEYNMPMLKRMMEKGDTLIDYECIKDENENRLIAFGKHAGIAGMIESLHTAGKRLKWEGYLTPLLHLKRPISYHSLSLLEKDSAKIGREIIQNGFPEELTPFVIGIAGYGHVSGGAQELLHYFPVTEIKPEDLETLEDNPHTLYKVVFREEHLMRRKDGGKFNLQDYYNNPENYAGAFPEYLPYISILINAIYWEEKYPRLVTKKWLKENYNKPVGERNTYRLRVIGDISCDIEGSIECTVRSTGPENPVYVYNPDTEEIKFGVEGKGPVIMAVDILPSELPHESSNYFSNILKRFIPEIINASYPTDFDKCTLPDPIKRAVILYKGKLTPRYKYIKKYIRR